MVYNINMEIQSYGDQGDKLLFRGGDSTTIADFIAAPTEHRRDDDFTRSLDTTAWQLLMRHAHGNLTPAEALAGGRANSCRPGCFVKSASRVESA